MANGTIAPATFTIFMATPTTATGTNPLVPKPQSPPAVNSQPAASDKSPKSQPDTPKTRNKDVFRVKIGPHLFDSSKGEILDETYVWLTTHRVSTALIYLHDPDAGLLKKLGPESEVQVEIGFVDGERRNKFIGKVQKLGRRPPDATVVHAVDVSTQLAQNTGASVTFAADKPADVQGRNLTEADGQTIDKIKAILNQAGSNPTVKTIRDIGDLVKKSDTKKLQEIEVIIQSGQKESPIVLSKKIAQAITNLESEPIGPSTSSGQSGQQSLLQIAQRVKRVFELKGEIASPAEQLVIRGSEELKFKSQSSGAITEQGTVAMQQTQLQTATQTAVRQGNLLVARGNTIAEVQPGKADPTSLVLDYVKNRSAFVGKPRILKRTGLQLPGAITVKGWDVSSKSEISATVTMPSAPTAHPTGVIVVPEWKDIKLNDPLFPGCPYTWADATRNGQRVPTKEIAARIVAIAQRITPLTEKTVGKGKRWNITSWYRDPAANRAAGGASDSRHMMGDAVDFYFETNGGEASLFEALKDSWEGGLAILPGSFVHLDDRGYRSRWVYG